MDAEKIVVGPWSSWQKSMLQYHDDLGFYLIFYNVAKQEYSCYSQLAIFYDGISTLSRYYCSKTWNKLFA